MFIEMLINYKHASICDVTINLANACDMISMTCIDANISVHVVWLLYYVMGVGKGDPQGPGPPQEFISS